MSKASVFVEALAAHKRELTRLREETGKDRPSFEVTGFGAFVEDTGHLGVEGNLSAAQIPAFLRWVEDTFGPFPETDGQKGDGDAD